jgi:hypothetical protein
MKLRLVLVSIVAGLALAHAGTAGAFSANPSSIDFGGVSVGTSILTHSVTVTVDSGYFFEGGESDPPFDVDPDTCESFTGPGTCTVIALFEPAYVGSYSSTVDLTECPFFEGPGCYTIHISVSGTGTQSEGPSEIGKLREFVAGLQIHHGIANALDSKLRAALTALAVDDTADACHSLQAFLNQVNAQTGKKLTLAQAQQLTDQATEIRTLLDC